MESSNSLSPENNAKGLLEKTQSQLAVSDINKNELDSTRYQFLNTLPNVSEQVEEILQLYEEYIPADQPESKPDSIDKDNTKGYFKGKTHGPVLDKTTGKAYISQFVNNEPHGFGEMITAEGASYKGDFQNGLPHGKGRFISANGDLYEGDFKEGKAEGAHCILHEAESMQRYEGSFKNWLIHGKGIKTYANGDRYK